MQTTNTLLTAALKYAKFGFRVLPVTPKGKIPVVKWELATTDPEVITSWWEEKPDYNIGLLTGSKSGIAVIDFDTTDAWKFGNVQGLPDAPMVKTAKGYHVYCSHQDEVRGFQKRSDLPGIDLRAEGNIIVAPPSIHESGTVYSWVTNKGLDELPLGILPQWLFPQKKELTLEEMSKGVSEGSRNNSLTQLVGRWISMGKSYEYVVNYAVKWNSKNTPPLSESEVIKTTNSIWKKENGTLPGLAEEWEAPIPLELEEPPEITSDLLPTWLGDYALAVSKNVQTPEALSVMVAIGVIATCLQRKFVVLPHGTEDYRESLALWMITVLPPSERKSAIVSTLTAPLNFWEQEQADAMKEQIIEVRNSRAILIKKIEKLRKEAADAEDNAAMASILEEIGELELQIPEEIYTPKLWASDVTPERLQDMLVEQGEKMALISDEAGIFNIMGGMYNKGAVNLDVFLQGYTGSSIRVERKSRPPVTLGNPALSFCLTVQPKVIEEFSKGNKDSFRGKGLLARFLFCYPKPVLGTRNVRASIPVPANIKVAYEQGIRRLLNIAQPEEPVAITFSEEARELWYDFWQSVEDSMAPDGDLYELADWAGKLHGNVARIAGLLHIAENGGNALIIGVESTQRAINIGRILIEHANKAFSEMGISEAYKKAARICKWIRDNKLEEFTKQKCQNNFGTLFPTSSDMDAPIKMLESHNIIRSSKIETGGRPSNLYKVNPQFLEILK